MGTARRSAPAHHDTGPRAGLSNTKNLTRLTVTARVLLPNATHDVLHRQSMAAAARTTRRPARWGKAYRPDPSEFEDTPEKEPPVNGSNVNPEVAAIAKEQGVNLNRAYTLLRERKMAEVDPSTVPQAIRDRILTVIATLQDTESITADMVAKAIQQMGGDENTHGVTHVLWSLQKTEHIRFRVSDRKGLHAIKLRPKGEERVAYIRVGTSAIATPKERASTNPWETDADVRREERAQYEAAHPRAQYPNGGAVVDQPDLGAARPGPLDEYPLVRDLLARTKAAEGYVAAAKAVEALGEDDMALTLLGKSTVTPLEDEVARLLADLGISER